ncbi:hypothetical protein BS50DRAFT_336800 [Corynespora cassiicola Philippines]|uniref:Uncharacterized protein n=1 Tax=Corynespora cassiicola Philippines TaxID=1448308 RepID=A0A2T2NV37_CORCC|nr:hypothetical protein BS50DRAFT_336800 [Corynespora cassiicola Philippines]
MPQLMSPRLPGVNVLAPDATGPQYTKWRRGLKSAFESKGTWGHCDGTVPMPMPESGPNYFTPVSTSNPQPQLLEERRAWVKQDREVKLDIFLSVADDIKLEVFEVGPPLPPPSMSAHEMLQALDERFDNFKFEDFHHVFCHFLNLHIDQYPNLEEFNAEFQATLDDLLDHGHPLSNLQAISAYFSKLRCTQNPWVTEKLKKWDALAAEPLLADLMKESPPWVIIRPLTTKPSQSSVPDSIPEEDLVDTPASSDVEMDEAASERSESATLSSKSSHSRQSSQSSQMSHKTSRSQEIIIHASYEDLTDLEAFPNVPAAKTASIKAPARISPKSDLSKMMIPPPPPVNRPLPPLPPDAEKSEKSSTRSRSISPTPNIQIFKPDSTLKVPSTPGSRPETPQRLEMTHPAFRPTTPTSPSFVHPALRPTTPNARPTTPNPSTPGASVFQGHVSAAMRPRTPSPPMRRPGYLASSPDLLVIQTPDLNARPSSSRSQRQPMTRVDSSNSSVISLPLQGTTIPEYKDTTITEKVTFQPSKLIISSSPPRSAVSRMSSDSSEEERDKKNRKRSWSIKARLSARRYEVKEII